ncbi:hypothetical protein [Nocardioides sediminis]|uniref:hypothetical protein n=1 Tax=Nocardioides sediminis TaxID=433648 RepID=UPI000D2F63B7|nr:hypothetical protein [Nocardioides sediminis]
MTIRFHRTALVAGAKQQEAAGFAAEVSQYVTETMGLPTTWGLQVGGPLSTVHWFTDFEDMAAMEAGLVKTITDAGYLKLLAKAEDLFVEGRSEDSIVYMM